MIPIYIYSGNIQPKGGNFKCVSLPALSEEDAKERLIAKHGELIYCSLTEKEEN